MNWQAEFLDNPEIRLTFDHFPFFQKQGIMENRFSFDYQHYDSPEGMPAGDRELVEEARRAVARAYAPYSKFRVGAAARLRSGKPIRIVPRPPGRTGSRLYCGVVQPHVTVTFSITTGDFPLFSNSNSCDTAPSASRIVPKFHTCCGNSNTEFWAGSIPVHKQPSNINPIFQLFIGSDDRCAKLSISREIRNSGA